MLLMIVNAGVPLLNLHQAGADFAGAQIPGSPAKAPICDFRSANEIKIGHRHLGWHVDLIERNLAAEEGQPLHEPHPALFYRRTLDAGDYQPDDHVHPQRRRRMWTELKRFGNFMTIRQGHFTHRFAELAP